MSVFIGRDRKVRRAYGFDEIALVPGDVTINPEEVDISMPLGKMNLPIPFLASAMDGVVDPKFAIAMGKLGGLAVLNLEGIYVRYDNYEAILDEISKATPEKATQLVQKLYVKPINEKLVAKRIREIKRRKCPALFPLFRNARSVWGKSRKNRARMFLWCNRPSPPCATFPKLTRRLILKSSARR